MFIRVKTKWSEPNDRWLLKFWNPMHNKWYQFWDIKENPWDCMTLDWLSGYKLDKDKEQIFNITVEEENGG
jgi:hypothetical protein